MELKVKAVSKFGFLAEEKDGWFNWGKFPVDHDNVNKGTVVDVEVNDKNIVKSLKVLSGASEKSHAASSSAAPRQTYDPATQDRIARGNACNAVFGSPMLAELLKTMDYSQAVQIAKDLIPQVAKYISQGEF